MGTGVFMVNTTMGILCRAVVIVIKIVMEKKIIQDRLWVKVEKHESAFLYSLDVSSAGQEAIDDGKPRIFSFGRSYLSIAPQHDYSTYLGTIGKCR